LILITFSPVICDSDLNYFPAILIYN